MPKSSKNKKFAPFTHENIDIKNELLQLARNARKQDQERKLENELASVLIYSNIAEYLAENLLENLNHFVKQSTYKDFGGILFLENVCSPDRKRTLNQVVDEIQKFSFPDKINILSCLRKIAESRNRIFHNFAKSDLETIKELINKDLPIIQDECEDVITRINTIYAGLGKILVTNTETKSPSEVEPQTENKG